MPFDGVPESNSSSQRGKFTTERRRFFNQCGLTNYCGLLRFRDSRYQERTVPIFYDDCLEGKPQTYSLLKNLRREMRISINANVPANLRPSPHNFPLSSASFMSRSIHQNENGYLPYKDDVDSNECSVSAPAISHAARLYGQLPNNQLRRGVRTKGQFLEYTFGDQMHVECRLLVDYRFGLIYMTLGHYNEHSFALLARSKAEFDFEIKPTMRALGVTVLGKS